MIGANTTTVIDLDERCTIPGGLEYAGKFNLKPDQREALTTALSGTFYRRGYVTLGDVLDAVGALRGRNKAWSHRGKKP